MELSYQQQDVFDLLKEVKTDKYPLHNWYIGALYALSNENNPDSISQAAHSLRELIEKLPRAVQRIDEKVRLPNFKEMRRKLQESFSEDKERYNGNWEGKEIDGQLDKTLKGIEEYFEKNKQPGRKEQVHKTLAAYDPLDNYLGNTVQETKRDELHGLWKKLEGFTHHQKVSATDELKDCLETLENIIFNLLAPITAQDQSEIKSILARSHRNKVDVQRMLLLIRRKGANTRYFLNHVPDTGVEWIPILKEMGYFNYLPSAERINGDKVNHPFWWPITYLNQVAATDPVLVVDTINDFQDTDNLSILRTIVEIALKVEPVEQSIRLKDWVFKYLKSPYYPTVNDSELIINLMRHWVRGKDMGDALQLMKLVVSFKPDPDRRNKADRYQKDPHGYSSALEPEPPFDQEEYDQILEQGVRSLSETAPFQVARILISSVAEMINNTYHKDQLEMVDDFDQSTIWCSRVNWASDHYQSPQEKLVHALTYACERVYETDADSIADLDQTLQEQRWYIFKRIRQHLYALHPNKQTKPWIRELILTHEDYDKYEYHFEFQRMLRVACENIGTDLLTMSEREQLFERILDGPSEKRLREFQDYKGDEFTEELLQEFKRDFHRRQLRPFTSVLYGEFADYFKELENAARNLLTDDNYWPALPSGVRRFEDQSPKSVDELAAMTDEELLQFLNKWDEPRLDPENWWVSITIKGLAGAFQTVFKEHIVSDDKRSRFWVNNKTRVKRPIYVRTMLLVIHERIKSGQFDQLNLWLELFEWVMCRAPNTMEMSINCSEESIVQPDWKNTRRAVGYFVSMCLSKAVNVPITARTSLALLLNRLCTLDANRERLEKQNSEIRSQALSNLVDFGFWVRRQLKDNDATIPEVFNILNQRLAPSAKPVLTLPESASLGNNFARLYLLDESWAGQYKSDLFPRDNLSVWTEAFRHFIQYFQSSYKPIAELIYDDIEFALENLNELKITNTDERNIFIKKLGHYTCYYYLWGLYPLTGNNSLLERYYDITSKEEKYWSHLFNQIGRVLSDNKNDMEDEIRERIFAFFDWRLKQRNPFELKGFTHWLRAECLDAEWRLKSYSKIICMCQDERLDTHTGIKILAEMVQTYTAPVLECFANLVETTVRKENSGYIRPDEAIIIIQAGLNDKNEAVRSIAKRNQELLLTHGII